MKNRQTPGIEYYYISNNNDMYLSIDIDKLEYKTTSLTYNYVDDNIKSIMDSTNTFSNDLNLKNGDEIYIKTYNFLFGAQCQGPDSINTNRCPTFTQGTNKFNPLDFPIYYGHCKKDDGSTLINEINGIEIKKNNVSGASLEYVSGISNDMSKFIMVCIPNYSNTSNSNSIFTNREKRLDLLNRIDSPFKWIVHLQSDNTIKLYNSYSKSYLSTKT